LIKKGKRIIVIILIETTNISRNLVIIRYLFLIKKKGKKNPITFKDIVDIREKIIKGYLKKLLKTKRINI